MLFEKRPRKIQKLLIVEDEPLIAFDTEYLLQSHGYEVIATVDNAEDALAAIGRGGIDLILSDVRLRDSDGRNVAIAAKAVGISLIFVTATCPIDAPSLALGCLAKPYSQADLKKTIEAIDAHLAGASPKRLPRGLTIYS